MSSLADQRRIDIIIEAQNRTRKVFQQIKKDIDTIQNSGAVQAAKQASGVVNKTAQAAEEVSKKAIRMSGNISRGITNVFQGMWQAAKTVFGSIRSMLGGIMGQFTMLAGSVGSVFAMWQAIKSFVALDALKLGMENIMDSAKAAQAEIIALQKIALKPGVTFQEALRASIQFQAAGIGAATSRKLVKGIANAIASVGGGAEDMRLVSLAITQIATMGNVYGQEIRQLQQRLPQIRKMLNEMYGTSKTEELQRRGITSDDFIEAFAEKLQKLPQIGMTTKGTIENIADAIFRMRAAMGESFLPIIKSISDFLMENEKRLSFYFANSLGKVVSWIMDNKNKIADFVVYVYRELTAIIANFRKFFDSISGQSMIKGLLGLVKWALGLVKALTAIAANPVVAFFIKWGAVLVSIIAIIIKLKTALQAQSLIMFTNTIAFRGMVAQLGAISAASTVATTAFTNIKVAATGLLGVIAKHPYMIAAAIASIGLYVLAIKPWKDAIDDLERSYQNLFKHMYKTRFSKKREQEFMDNPSAENIKIVREEYHKLKALRNDTLTAYSKAQTAYNNLNWASPVLDKDFWNKKYEYERLQKELDLIESQIEATEQLLEAMEGLAEDASKTLEPLGRMEQLEYLIKWKRQSVEAIKSAFGDVSKEYKAKIEELKALQDEKLTLAAQDFYSLDEKNNKTELYFKRLDALNTAQAELNAVNEEYLRIEKDIADKAIKDRIDGIKSLISVQEKQLAYTESIINVMSKYDDRGVEKFADAQMAKLGNLVEAYVKLANDPDVDLETSIEASAKQMDLMGKMLDLFYSKYDRQTATIQRQIDIVKSQSEVYQAMGNSQLAMNNSTVRQIQLEKEKLEIYKEALAMAEKMGHVIKADALRVEINKTTAEILKMQQALTKNMDDEFKKMTMQIINAPKNMTELLARTGVALMNVSLRGFSSNYQSPLRPTVTTRPVINVYIGDEKLKTDMYEVAEQATMDTLIRSGAFA